MVVQEGIYWLRGHVLVVHESIWSSVTEDKRDGVGLDLNHLWIVTPTLCSPLTLCTNPDNCCCLAGSILWGRDRKHRGRRRRNASACPYCPESRIPRRRPVWWRAALDSVPAPPVQRILRSVAAGSKIDQKMGSEGVEELIYFNGDRLRRLILRVRCVAQSSPLPTYRKGALLVW